MSSLGSICAAVRIVEEAALTAAPTSRARFLFCAIFSCSKLTTRNPMASANAATNFVRIVLTGKE